jgi:hypothetical protein
MAVIELGDQRQTLTVARALESYRMRLGASIDRTQRKLDAFEKKYHTTTKQFLELMTAEDLEGGDLEYVEWAGEAWILESLQTELKAIDGARSQLP